MKQKVRGGRRAPVVTGVIGLLICLVLDMGIGYYASGSAVLDLLEGLEAIHGEQYAGRKVENGTEDMEFTVQSDTFFMTDYSWRKFFRLDYKYKCNVSFILHSDEGPVSIRTLTYDGIDPMGPGEGELRAYIDTETVRESIWQTAS